MKKEETINLNSIWVDVVKAIDNIKNNDSEKAKQLIESIMKLTWHITLKLYQVSKINPSHSGGWKNSN